MEFILKTKCPVCGCENEAEATISASKTRSAVSAIFVCIGAQDEGCKTSYRIEAQGETAEMLIKLMICGG